MNRTLVERFVNFGFLPVLIVMIYGINQIDAKEFINEEFNIKFEYPDEWKLETYTRQAATFGIEYDQIPVVGF